MRRAVGPPDFSRDHAHHPQPEPASAALLPGGAALIRSRRPIIRLVIARTHSHSPAPTLKTKHLPTAGIAALCAFTFTPAARVHATGPQYTATDLGTLGGSGGAAYGINNAGQVTGNSRITGDTYARATLWSAAPPQDLGAPIAGTYSGGYGINATGDVAGYTYTADGYPRAARWIGGVGESLGTLSGPEYTGYNASYAFGINASGQVAGYSVGAGGGSFEAVRWTGTTAVALDNLGGYLSYGYAINDAGQVAGYSLLTGNAAFRAVRWTGTTAVALGTLGGNSSVGYGINAAGWVVGYSLTAGDTAYHATLWTGTAPIDIGTLGGVAAVGYAINASGDVVGESQLLGTSTYDPFLYTGGTMYDLNDLLVPGSGVTQLGVGSNTGNDSGGNSINDLGQIAAYGVIGGQLHALRLDPVATPEPASAVLLLGGAALLGLRRRR